MVLPPGHGKAVAAPRGISGRERRMISGVLVLAAALIAALVISLATGGRASSHGCIHATIPGAVGAQEIDQCGAQARTTCQSAEQPGAFTPSSARVIASECRKAGLAVR